MLPYKEILEQAVANVEMLGTHGVWTVPVKLYIATKAVHRYQEKTEAVKRLLSVATSSLDSEGSVTIDTDIQKIIRAELYTTGSSDPILVSVVADDYFTQIKRDGITQPIVNVAGQPSSRYMVTRMREKLFFYPFSGVAGSIKLHYLPKLMPYSPARGALSTGDYANANVDLGAWIAANSPPSELDAAEEAIIAYTSAQLLRSIKNWKKLFRDDYEEWMSEYQSMIDDVMNNHYYNNLATNAPLNGGPGS